MRPISQKNKDILATDPYYKKCARADEGDCSSVITIEHSILYAGRQIDDLWNLLPICEYHHAVNKYMDCGKMNKEKHEWLALRQAPPEAREKYYKIDWSKLDRLNKKYA
jgi:hypothetical protein